MSPSRLMTFVCSIPVERPSSSCRNIVALAAIDSRPLSPPSILDMSKNKNCDIIINCLNCHLPYTQISHNLGIFLNKNWFPKSKFNRCRNYKHQASNLASTMYGKFALIIWSYDRGNKNKFVVIRLKSRRIKFSLFAGDDSRRIKLLLFIGGDSWRIKFFYSLGRFPMNNFCLFVGGRFPTNKNILFIGDDSDK